MSTFLDKTGLSTLWEKIKSYIAKYITDTTTTGFNITDDKGNIGLSYNEDGLDVAKVTDHFLEVVTPNIVQSAISSIPTASDTQAGIIKSYNDSSVYNQSNIPTDGALTVYGLNTLLSSKLHWMKTTGGGYTIGISNNKPTADLAICVGNENKATHVQSFVTGYSNYSTGVWSTNVGNYSPNPASNGSADENKVNFTIGCGYGSDPRWSLVSYYNGSNPADENNGNIYIKGIGDYTGQYVPRPSSNASLQQIIGINDSYTTPTTDTAGHWTVTIPGVTRLYDGLKIHIRLGTIHYLSGELYNTLNVNGLGAKLVWYRYNKVFTDQLIENDELTLTYRTDAGSYKVNRNYGELTNGTTYTDGWVCEGYAGNAIFASTASSLVSSSYATRCYCPVYFANGRPYELAGQEYFSYTNTNGYCFPMFSYTEVQKSAVGSYTFTFPPIVTFELHFSYWYYGTTSIPVQTILKGTVCLATNNPSIHWEIVSHNNSSTLTKQLKDIVWDIDNKRMVLRLQRNIAGDGKYIAAMYCANYGSPRITINSCDSSSGIAESSLSSNLVTFDIPTASTEDRIKALETKLTTYNGQ